MRNGLRKKSVPERKQNAEKGVRIKKMGKENNVSAQCISKMSNKSPQGPLNVFVN